MAHIDNIHNIVLKGISHIKRSKWNTTIWSQALTQCINVT